jgi:hypothetical protein
MATTTTSARVGPAPGPGAPDPRHMYAAGAGCMCAEPVAPFGTSVVGMKDFLVVRAGSCGGMHNRRDLCIIVSARRRTARARTPRYSVHMRACVRAYVRIVCVCALL